MTFASTRSCCTQSPLWTQTNLPLSTLNVDTLAWESAPNPPISPIAGWLLHHLSRSHAKASNAALNQAGPQSRCRPRRLLSRRTEFFTRELSSEHISPHFISPALSVCSLPDPMLFILHMSPPCVSFCFITHQIRLQYLPPGSDLQAGKKANRFGKQT